MGDLRIVGELVNESVRDFEYSYSYLNEKYQYVLFVKQRNKAKPFPSEILPADKFEKVRKRIYRSILPCSIDQCLYAEDALSGRGWEVYWSNYMIDHDMYAMRTRYKILSVLMYLAAFWLSIHGMLTHRFHWKVFLVYIVLLVLPIGMMNRARDFFETWNERQAAGMKFLVYVLCAVLLAGIVWGAVLLFFNYTAFDPRPFGSKYF